MQVLRTYIQKSMIRECDGAILSYPPFLWDRVGLLLYDLHIAENPTRAGRTREVPELRGVPTNDESNKLPQKNTDERGECIEQ